MAIFELLKNNSLAHESNIPVDLLRGLDFLAGTILILLFLLSTFLNPIVFFHYWKLPSTIPNILYRILAFSDFSANVIRPLLNAFMHFSPNVLTEILLETTIRSNIFTIIIIMSMTLSIASVALLAVTRAIKIQWPFYRVKKRMVFCWLGSVALLQFVVTLSFISEDRNLVRNFVCSGTCVSIKVNDLGNGKERIQLSVRTLMAAFLMYFHAFISVVVSIWAIASLAIAIRLSKVTKNINNATSNRNEPELKLKLAAFQKILKKFKSCRAIIMVNFTSMMMVISAATMVARSQVITQIGPENVGHCRVAYTCQTLSGPLPQSGSPAREARGAAAAAAPHISNVKLGRNVRQAYTANVIVPSIMSATNPLILVWYNEDLRARLMFCKNTTDQSVGRSQNFSGLRGSSLQQSLGTTGNQRRTVSSRGND